MANRAGHYKTNLSGEMAYQSFVPCPLPPDPTIEFSDELISLLIKANSQLAVLESVATRIPNVELFVSMYHFYQLLQIGILVLKNADFFSNNLMLKSKTPVCKKHIGVFMCVLY